MIDRKDPVQAVAQIEKVGTYIEKHGRSVVIYPEGTRSRDGLPKPFKRKGLLQLFNTAPSAYVVPVSINNSWKLQRFGMFPIPVGTHFRMKVHPAIKVSDHDPEVLIDLVESTVLSEIEKPSA